MSGLRIFLADNEPIYRVGLKSLIREETDFSLAGEADDGESALREVIRLKPDVAVFDVSMPGLNSAEAFRQVLRSAPDLRLIAITVSEDTAFARQLLENGASGFVRKQAKAQIILDAIRAVADGRVYIDPAIGSRMVQGYLKTHGNGCKPELSERERSVLQLIAQGYTNKEIAARLRLSVKTIETYKIRSMDKLRLDSRVDVVRYAFAQGWLQGM